MVHEGGRTAADSEITITPLRASFIRARHGLPRPTFGEPSVGLPVSCGLGVDVFGIRFAFVGYWLTFDQVREQRHSLAHGLENLCDRIAPNMSLAFTWRWVLSLAACMLEIPTDS
jgi:hypothetical protein